MTTDSNLTFLEKTSKLQANFSCVCGNIINRYISEVRIGRVKSCGCVYKNKLIDRAKQLVGKKFNDLTVISFEGRNKYNLLMYRVRCVCGKEFTTSKSNLKRQKGCGCQFILPIEIGQVIKNYKVIEILKNRKCKVKCIECDSERCLLIRELYDIKQYKCICKTGYLKNLNNISKEEREKQRTYRLFFKDCLRRGRICELTFEQATKLFNDNCFYCNSPPVEYAYKGFRNGIDRVDSLKNYTIDNSVTCCYNCNIMKNNLSKEEFKQHICKIYNHFCNSDR